MMLPPSDPVRALPAQALQNGLTSRWRRATRDGHYEAWGAGVLVNVKSSKLVAALPLMKYALRNGQLFLPLNVIAHLLGRLGWVKDDRLKIGASGLSAVTLASFEEWAVTDGRLDWSPTSETGFLQRVLTLAAELSAAVELPAALKITAGSFVPFNGHDDSAGRGRPPADWSGSWQSRMKVSSLTSAQSDPRVCAPRSAQCC